MANNVTGNPLIIDTLTSTAIIATSERFQVYAIHWASASVANICSVQDGAGTVRYEVVAASANVPPFVLSDAAELNFNGLKVPTLDSGKVYIYIKRT